MELFYLNQASA